ncbi:hypothetical protein HON22_00570 [Candidatus Peregrinibacteria bacterium]|nr:hypothetical protein [Candidatus Peregrinibacteria bacterium]
MGNTFDSSQFGRWLRMIIPDGKMQANKMENCFATGCQSLMASMEKMKMNKVDVK